MPPHPFEYPHFVGPLQAVPSNGWVAGQVGVEQGSRFRAQLEPLQYA